MTQKETEKKLMSNNKAKKREPKNIEQGISNDEGLGARGII